MKSVRVDFSFTQDEQIVLSSFHEKNQLIERIGQISCEISMKGIDAINSFELESINKRLQHIESILISHKNHLTLQKPGSRFDAKAVYECAMKNIKSCYEIINLFSKWYFTPESWNQEIKDKEKELLTLNEWQLENELTSGGLQDNILEIFNRYNPLCKKISNLVIIDYVAIHSDEVLNKANANALVSLIQRYPKIEIIQERLKENVFDEIDKLRKNNPPNKLNYIINISKKVTGKGIPIKIFPKKIYLIAEIENYIKNREADKREFTTTFLSIEFGISRTTQN